MFLVTSTPPLAKFVSPALRDPRVATMVFIPSTTDHSCKVPAVYACFSSFSSEVVLATFPRVHALLPADPLCSRRPRTPPSTILEKPFDS